MTGLNTAALPSANPGVWLGGSEISGAPASNPAGALLFLDVLGLLDMGSPTESSPLEELEEGLAEGSVAFHLDAPPTLVEAPAAAVRQATTKQIAAAVIRSMLQSPSLPSPDVPQAASEITETAPSLHAVPAAEEDWDIALDWVAPEESDEFFQDWVDSDAPTISDAPVATAPLCLAPQPVRTEPQPSQAAGAIRGGFSQTGVAAGQTSRPAQPREIGGKPSTLLSTQIGEPVQPLAFGMKLTPASETGVEAETGVPLTIDEKSAPKSLAPTQTTAEKPLTARAGNRDRAAGSDQVPPAETRGLAEPSSGRGKEREPSSHRDPSLAAKPMSPVRGRAAHAGASPATSTTTAIPPATSLTAHPTPQTPKVTGESQPVLTGTTGMAGAQPAEQPSATKAPSSVPREIAVRISAPDAAPVDLQVKERGGAVLVAVRTPDEALQTALRQDLGSLVERLEQNGLQTEAVTTREMGALRESSFDLSGSFRASATEASGRGGSNEQAPEKEGSDAREHGSGARQQQSQQRRQQQTQQPPWLGIQETEEQA